MISQDVYIAQVLERLPRDAELRRQVEMELRSHIAERLEHGSSLDEALRQFGDPATLADSYLEAVPLVAPRFWPRFAAKLVDFVVVMAPFAVLIGLALADNEPNLFLPLAILFLVFSIPGYSIVAEYKFSKTVGKHLFGLRVVRESGGRISFGQSIVRQLPAFFQVFWVDALFALFTEKRQRAFELLSKTRVVIAPARSERGVS
jgi:uncharacterized RDD family membrane protein YckC